MVGPQFMEDDFAGVLSGEFGEPVTIDYKSFIYYTKGIFDLTYQEANSDGTISVSKYSRLVMDDNTLIDLLGEEIKDTEIVASLTITMRSVIYRVYTPERDGQGLIILNLKTK